eukprot:TRINITY_DN28996_c0_g1_i1.p1 TRINITY_DN28996_c0_g1~~TRINITY_DN28996_c0_g1_i1.p1  ORF type:complete len:367 (+),score=124.88 TRINITY_DN28996_c0_g1_i1:94-1101(+)
MEHRSSSPAAGDWALPGAVPAGAPERRSTLSRRSGSDGGPRSPPPPLVPAGGLGAAEAAQEGRSPAGPPLSAIESLQAVFHALQTEVRTLERSKERLRLSLERFKELADSELRRVLELADRRKEVLRKELLGTIQQLNAEAEEMKKRAVAVDDIIGLNVGGRVFTTTRATLCRERDSLLASLFDPAAEAGLRLPVDSDGNFFIDRDGRLFAIALNFLRTFSLPDGLSHSDLRLLRAEADFFGIQSLADLISEARDTAREQRCRYTVMTYNSNFVPSSFMGSAPQGIELFYFQDDCYKSYKDMAQVLADMRERGWHPVLNVPASTVNGRIVFCKDE